MLNEVKLIGNVGADPEISSVSSGDKVANLSIATTERWKNKETGEQNEKTQWHRVVVWSQGLVGVIEKYVKKGDRLYVTGALETRKWQDQDGNDKYSTEVVLRNFDSKLLMLSPAGEGGGSASAPAPAATAPVEVENDDSEIPF